MRSRSLARSTVLMLVVAALLVGMFVTLKAFTLSGTQVAERDLGRFAYAADLSAVIAISPERPVDVLRLTRAVRAAGATDAQVSLTSFDIEPAMIHPPVTNYVETDWTDKPMPGRFTLMSGRWPSRPGEVVVTEALRSQVSRGEVLSVLSGRERFDVVGIARDQYSAWSLILGAPGTWSGLSPDTLRAFPDLSAYATLYWDGASQPAVIGAVAEAIATNPSGRSPASVAETIQEVTTSRAELLSRQSAGWVERIPLAYKIPSLALPLLAVLVIFGLNNRRFQRSMSAMTSIGMRRSRAVAGIAAAVSAWTVVSMVLGSLAGLGLGLLARLVIVSTGVYAAPLSPLPWIGPAVLRVAAVTVSGCLLMAVALHVSSRPERRASPEGATSVAPAGGSRGHAIRTGRRCAVIVVAALAVIEVSSLSTITDAMALTATIGVVVLLVVPDMLALVLRRLPRREPRLRLARKQLSHDRPRGVVAVAVLSVALGAPIGLLILVATLVRSDESGLSSPPAPGQVLLSGGGGFLPPSDGVVRAVTSRVGLDQEPVRVRILGSARWYVSVAGGDLGAMLAIDTPEDVARLANRPLSTEEAQTLRGGGALVWDDYPKPGPVLETRPLGDSRVLARTPPLRVIVADFEPAWQVSTRGVLLTSTAGELGLPTSQGGLVYTGVSAADTRAAEDASVTAGFDRRDVSVYEPPPDVIVPAAYLSAAVGLGLVVIVTTMAVARTQVATLRRYLGALVSVGLSTRWVRQVLLVQSAVALGISTLLALVIGLTPLAIASWRITGLTLAVPWTALAVLVVAFYLAAVTATLLSSRRLKAADRTFV